ncbi:Peroxidase [Bertholletia excelsa]
MKTTEVIPHLCTIDCVITYVHGLSLQGCEASVLLDSTPRRPAEKASTINSGLAGFEVIDTAKAEIESRYPNTVSCADILAFAARDAVFKAGSICYNVPPGRHDGRVSLEEEAAGNLPGAFSNVTQLTDNFAHKGLSLQEMVVLSGAHLIGDGPCSAFSRSVDVRLFHFSQLKVNTEGNKLCVVFLCRCLYSFNATHPTESSLDWAYANYLKAKCPRQGNDPVVPFDPATPV